MELIDILKFGIELVGVSAVLYLIYMVALRYKCSYNFARAYLLLTPIVALLSMTLTFNVLPAQKNESAAVSQTQVQLVKSLLDNFISETQEVIVASEQSAPAPISAFNEITESSPSTTPLNATFDENVRVEESFNGGNMVNVVLIVGLLYLAVFIIRSLLIGKQLHKIKSIKRWATKEIFNGSTLYRSGLIETPFSFMQDIFVDRATEGDKLELIVQHELSHIQNKHYLDKNVIELISLFMWFNPIVWLIRNELGAIHEFQADNSVIKGGANIKTYQQYLFEEIMSKSPAIANGFNHSLIKKRMIMMKNSETIKHLTIRSFIAGISLIGVFVFMSFKHAEPSESPTSKVESSSYINVVEKPSTQSSSTESTLEDGNATTNKSDTSQIKRNHDKSVANFYNGSATAETTQLFTVGEATSKESELFAPTETNSEIAIGLFDSLLITEMGHSPTLSELSGLSGTNTEALTQKDGTLSTNDLVGTWRLESSNHDNINNNSNSSIHYKILRADGTYTNFYTVLGETKPNITHQGKYEILMDGIYVETDEFNERNALSDIDPECVISYKRTKNRVKMKFHLKLMGPIFNEVWEKTSNITLE